MSLCHVKGMLKKQARQRDKTYLMVFLHLKVVNEYLDREKQGKFNK
jgi:hypothetical protein